MRFTGKSGCHARESSALVELVLKEISDSVARGETVKLSSFGTHSSCDRRVRASAATPKTGAEAPISPRRVVVFKASPVVKQQINGRPSI